MGYRGVLKKVWYLVVKHDQGTIDFTQQIMTIFVKMVYCYGKEQVSFWLVVDLKE